MQPVKTFDGFHCSPSKLLTASDAISQTFNWKHSAQTKKINPLHAIIFLMDTDGAGQMLKFSLYIEKYVQLYSSLKFRPLNYHAAPKFLLIN